MGVAWGSSSQRRAHTRRAIGSSGSAALLSPPRFLSNRGVISRWLRASASLGSSQRVPSFRGLLGTPPSPLMSSEPRMPSQRDTLDALARVTAAVQAEFELPAPLGVAHKATCGP